MRVFNPRKVRYAKVIDTILGSMYRITHGKRTAKSAGISTPEPKRILVIESHLIGDVVMALPALKALRRRFPSSRITLAAGGWASQLLSDQNVVDGFAEIRFPWSTYDYSWSNLKSMFAVLADLRGSPWDLGIDLRGDIRNIVFLYLTKATRRISYNFTGGEYLLTDVVHDDPKLKHIVEYNLHIVGQLGCSTGEPTPRLAVPETEMEIARRNIGQGVGPESSRIIGIHPGASKPLRLWREDRFARLGDLIMKDPRNRVLLIEGPSEGEKVRRIRAAMKSEPLIIRPALRELAAVLRCCDLLVGLDSGPVHVAAAVGVPTIVLCGPAEPEHIRPYSERVSIVIIDGYVCRPCDQVHCVQPGNNCMDAIDVSAVYSRVLLALEKNVDYSYM
jgi:ADP-heptose:LPS heptosyltransferase